MKLTKKVIEKKFNVTLIREDRNMADSYLSWTAYRVDEDGELEEIAWCDTLAEIVEELEKLKKEAEI